MKNGATLSSVETASPKQQPIPLATMQTKQILVLTFCAITASSATAAIFVSGDLSSEDIIASHDGDNIYIDIGNNSATAATSGTWDLRLSFEAAEQPVFEGTDSPPDFYAVHTVTTGTAPFFTSYVALMESGDAPTGETAFADDGMENNGLGPWNAGTDTITGYATFQSETGQGWAHLLYDDGANSVQLLEFAYNDSGTLNAGAVPEPSTYPAITGVFALGMALWRRRKR
ncbi:MAG: PEP-CTERM sorting domain-containing protein [Opitutales bacterium]